MRVKWNGSLSGTFSASNGVKLVELVREMLTVVSKSFIVGLIVNLFCLPVWRDRVRH